MKVTIDAEFYIKWIGKFRGINDSYRSHSIHSISYPSGTELNRNIETYLKEHPGMVLYDKIMQQKIKFEFNNKPFDLVIVEETIVIEEIDELKAAKKKGIMIKPNRKEQKDILKSLKKLWETYLINRNAILYEPLLSIFYHPNPYLKGHYRYVTTKTREAIKEILDRYELPENNSIIKKIRADMDIKI